MMPTPAKKIGAARRALELRLTHEMPFDEIGRVLECEYPDATWHKVPAGAADGTPERWARALVGFNVWSASKFGFEWSAETSSWVRVREWSATERRYVRIAPSPPGPGRSP